MYRCYVYNYGTRIVMKVVRIMGGLGNQMFQYALYLALKHHCKEEIKIDLEFFKGNVKDIAIHNGYELNRVFNIVAPVASPVEVYLSGFKNSEYQKSLLRRIRFKLLMRRKLFEKLNPQETYAFFDDFLNNRYSFLLSISHICECLYQTIHG